MFYANVLNILLFLAAIFFLCKCYRCRKRESLRENFYEKLGMGNLRYCPTEGVVICADKEFMNIMDLEGDPESIAGHSLKDIFVPVDELAFPEGDKFTYKEKVVVRDFKVKTLKGKEKDIKYRAYSTHDKYTGGKVIVSAIEDITESTAVRKELEGSREKYRTLFNGAGDMALLFDLFGRGIVEANPAAETLTGFTRQELCSDKVDSIVHPLERSSFIECLKDLVFSERTLLETVLVCKDGSYRDVIFTLTRFELSEKSMAMGIVKDISLYSRKKYEEKVRQKEIEDFWKASIEREERIYELRKALEQAKKKINELENNNKGSDID